ncbi:MAG TPA: hypothetical protein VFV50_02975 [Bdellovibrionales bacterium]|nr:hypothetical protein [Bdellovibrionales bacterium]
MIAPILIVCAVVSSANHPILAWSAVCFVVACLVVSQFVIRAHRENKFRADFLDYIERVIMFVRSGKPFRLALTNACDDIEPFTQKKIAKILEFVFFSQQSDLMTADLPTQNLVRELMAIDRSVHKSLERLVIFRRNLRLEHEFRSKAGQALRRMRWQSYILTGLYLALLAFVLNMFSWREIWPFLWISVTFFVTGLCWMMLAGRKIKWKI